MSIYDVEKTGGPAFPCSMPQKEELHIPGMSLRDYFAAKAMQGLLAQHSTEECESGNRDFVPDYSYRDRVTLAARAWLIADAMLAARSSVENLKELAE